MYAGQTLKFTKKSYDSNDDGDDDDDDKEWETDTVTYLETLKKDHDAIHIEFSNGSKEWTKRMNLQNCGKYYITIGYLDNDPIERITKYF